MRYFPTTLSIFDQNKGVMELLNTNTSGAHKITEALSSHSTDKDFQLHSKC